MATAGVTPPVLVIGGTGHVGQKVVQKLLQAGKRVRLLSRSTASTGDLEKLGAEVVRGDMMQPATLSAAFQGIDTVISCAAGYTGRQKKDTLDTDLTGNKNTVDAALAAGVKRFILLSILNCELATDVPHFYAKKIVEDYLLEKRVPFVSVRAGAFIDQAPSHDFVGSGVKKGAIVSLWNADTPASMIYTGDLADYLVAAVDAPVTITNKLINVGCNKPGITYAGMAVELSSITQKRIKIGWPGPRCFKVLLGLGGVFNSTAHDLKKMVQFIESGKYVLNDATLQTQFFGPPPSYHASLYKFMNALGLAAADPTAAAAAAAAAAPVAAPAPATLAATPAETHAVDSAAGTTPAVVDDNVRV